MKNIIITNKQVKTFLTTTTTAVALSLSQYANAEVLNSTSPISPQAMVAQMGTGVDATWSEVPNKIADYTPQATVEFANKGFKHVRLRLAQDPAADTWSYLDGQIQDALDNGMIPIIANQSHTFEDNPNATTQAAWVKWWGDMAEHYKDYPYELMFDLIVEIAASSPLSDEPINQLNTAYEDAVNAIRNAGGNNDKRIIIFSAHKRSDPTKMHLLDIPTQGNGYLIGEFHEGYASGPSTDPTNPHYYWDGSEAEIALMMSRRDAAIAWSTSTGIPIWEGAWMPGNYNKGDDYDNARQIAFSTDFIGVLNEHKIPHAVNATKKFYDVSTSSWTSLEPVVDAIIALEPADVNPIIFSDDFESGDLSAWSVSGVSGSADATAATSGSYGALLKNTTRIKATVSSVGYNHVTLSYDRKTSGYDNGEYLKVEYSIDGGNSFINLNQTDDNSWVTEIITLPTEALGLANLVIKFVGTADKNGEKSYIDNVRVSGE